jgi:hypothetical protein
MYSVLFNNCYVVSIRLLLDPGFNTPHIKLITLSETKDTKENTVTVMILLALLSIASVIYMVMYL